jgi:hypothetical protein
MSTQAIPASKSTFKLAWITLLAMAVIATLNHLALALVMPGETTLFIGWAAYTGYAAAVLAVPFRRGERWAWYSTWILVLGFASLIFFDAQVGAWYAGGAAVMAVCLLVTRSAFVTSRYTSS